MHTLHDRLQVWAKTRVMAIDIAQDIRGRLDHPARWLGIHQQAQDRLKAIFAKARYLFGRHPGYGVIWIMQSLHKRRQSACVSNLSQRMHTLPAYPGRTSSKFLQQSRNGRAANL